jgi:proline- and glutamine-rich splicing factor
MRKQKLIALDREMKLEEDKLVAQMEYAKYEHETEKMRAELREREANRDQRRNQWEQRERETQVRWYQETNENEWTFLTPLVSRRCFVLSRSAEPTRKRP